MEVGVENEDAGAGPEGERVLPAESGLGSLCRAGRGVGKVCKRNFNIAEINILLFSSLLLRAAIAFVMAVEPLDNDVEVSAAIVHGAVSVKYYHASHNCLIPSLTKSTGRSCALSTRPWR